MSSFGGSFGANPSDFRSDKARSLVGSRYSEKSLADTNKTGRFDNLGRQSEALGRELDLVNQTHWKYNSDQDRDFYVNYRLAVQKVYENTPTTIPFKEMIEDPTLSHLKSTRLAALQSKIADLSDLLSQANLGVPPASWNPYYDNSANAKPNYEQTRELERERERIRDEYDREVNEAPEIKKNSNPLESEAPLPTYKESRMADWVSRNYLSGRTAADILRAEQEENKQFEAQAAFNRDTIGPYPSKAQVWNQHGENSSLQKDLNIQLGELRENTRRLKQCLQPAYQPTQVRLKDMPYNDYILHEDAVRMNGQLPMSEVVRRQEGAVSRMMEYERLAKRAREKRI